MTKYYLFAKKVHRILVLIITVISLLMALTGLILKYPALNLNLFDLGLIRYLHNQLSPLFGIVLFAMIITGIWMYLYPVLMKHQVNKKY